jgi:proteasome beta subunit
MTLVIAMRCSDGLIMASDSQATEATGNVRHPTQKLHALGARAVWGGSGGSQVLQRHYSNHLMPVPGLGVSSPASAVLAAGLDSDGQPYIIEVDPYCTYTRYEDLGFHAIGSAAGFAQLANALMAHFRAPEQPLAQCKLVTYRVMDSAIETSSYGVGGPIQMWVVDANGVAEIGQAEFDQIRNDVGGWKEVERSALQEYFAGAQAEAPTMPEPATTEAAVAEPAAASAPNGTSESAE